MRLFGILAIFVLAIAAIVEAAVLVRLSSRLDFLSEKLETTASESDLALRVKTGPVTASGSVGSAAAAPSPRPLPRLVPAPAASEPSPESASATAVLRQALDTVEGRNHLRSAMELVREQERQERLVRSAERDMTEEQQYRERLVRLAGVTPDEQHRIGLFYTGLQNGRQRLLDEMRAGTKSAEQADEEIDNLRDEAQRQVRTLLGEERMNKFREASRAERRRERGRPERPGPGGVNVNAAPPAAPAP